MIRVLKWIGRLLRPRRRESLLPRGSIGESLCQKVDEKDLAYRLQVEANGVSDGKIDKPSSDDTRLSDVELKIISSIETARDRSWDAISTQLDVYTERLSGLNFSSQEDQLASIAREIESDYATIQKRKLSAISRERQAMINLVAELRSFRELNNLVRQPDYPESRIFHWGFLSVLIVVEMSQCCS